MEKPACRVIGRMGCLVLVVACNVLFAQEGWTELTDFLVVSDGTHSLGDTDADFNETRDQGSKIVFFDRQRGDNAAAEVYWWDGHRIVDSSGSPTNADGTAYGANPLDPNEDAIKPFAYPIRDPRLRSHYRVAAGYPDLFLLRRGHVHDTFDIEFWGGRSETEPMVVAAYGPLADGRAIVEQEGSSPLSQHTHGDTVVKFHQVLAGLEVYGGLSHLGMHDGCTSPGAPGVPTWLIEDCRLVNAQMNYLPIGTTVRRSISAFRRHPDAHNQGYFTSGFDAATTFDEVIFYKNGYNNDPRANADPSRDIFSRN
ncbi:MAG: hypothetical protein GF331_02520, partial [Chitinivibrionales bacterium]|nr:hypothetical protein [Chitinivibrionales bacterium]